QMNTFKEERTKLPTLGRLGVMFPVHFTSSTISAILAADLVKVIDENIRFHAGTELILWNQLALRTGIQAGYESHSLNFGIGIMRAGLRLSYAILPFEDDLGTSHQFTLGFDI
ncbi:MAG: hypothetical protein JXL67_06540, partial [Calditrichaeota bacterium]|nr:hypothetical protein [Calditrichota bacterium]